MSPGAATARVWVAAALLLALVLASQAAADALAAGGTRAATGAVLGRTGFAYLSGIRRYAGAVLYARLDPITDAYYPGRPLGQQKFLVPSIRIVTWLDPEAREPYYVGPWVIYGAGRKAEAVAFAREGAANNPDSAILRASLAQLLMTEGRLAEARTEADIAVTKTWENESDQFQLLAALAVIYNRTGSPDTAAALNAQRESLRRKFEATGAMPERAE